MCVVWGRGKEKPRNRAGVGSRLASTRMDARHMPIHSGLCLFK